MPQLPQVPVVSFMSPVLGDTMLAELWNTELGSYAELPVGSPHPDAGKWPGYVLVSNHALDGTEKWIIRYWTADEILSDTFNLAQRGYDGDDNTKELLIRHYLVRRKDYEPETKLSKLTGVLAVRMTVAGSTYDSTATVTFSGGAGSGATGVPLVFRGTIVGVRMTSEGTGYTSAPTATFSVPVGGGTTATGVAVIQNTGAVLVRETADRMEGDPVDGVYLRVTRTYMVLPGAWLPFTRYDHLLGPIQGQRRAVAYTGQVASLTATVKTNYESRDGSSIVAWEIVETNSDGSGGAGNPVYPTLEDDFYDAERGAVSSRSQLIAATGSEVGSFSFSGSTAIWTRYEAYNQFLVRAIVERWASPGPQRLSQQVDPDSGTLVNVGKKLKKRSDIVADIGVTSNVLTVVEIEPSRYAAEIAHEVITTIPQDDAHSRATARTEYAYQPYTFPGLFRDPAYIDQGDGAIGYRRPFTAMAKHKISTWWINSETMPDEGSDGADVNTIIADSITIDNQEFHNVIHDEITNREYPSGAHWTLPETSPNYTDYFGTWEGNFMVIDGSVRQVQFRYRWKIVEISVEFVGIEPVLVP